MSQPANDRRQTSRIPLSITPSRARRWVAGAWRDVSAVIVDLSSHGIGVSLESDVRLGDRLSVAIPMGDQQPDLRLTFEVRHVHPADASGRFRAGGLFRGLAPRDQQRIAQYVGQRQQRV